MIEEYTPSPKDMGIEKKSIPEFDREAEKGQREEIRKVLAGRISEVLKDMDFKKKDNSSWYRQSGRKLEMAYLQRGSFAHLYYFEVGKMDIPPALNPKEIKSQVRIENCSERARIQHIASKADFPKNEIDNKDPNDLSPYRTRELQISSLLEFDKPGSAEDYPDEYFYPSISTKEATAKIEEFGEIIEKYLPDWFSDEE